MCKRLYWAVLLAAAGLVGCNEKTVDLSTDEISTGEKIQLTVKLPVATTKVTGPASDDHVGDIQVFVFDKNGVYETSSSGGGSSLSLTCTTGEKKIVALVNAPKENGVRNIDELRARTADLADCSENSIVMAGEVTKVLESSATLTMTVERIAAKVAVEKITTDFTLDQHKDLDFKVKSIYLINVAGERAYLVNNTPSLWYNAGEHIDATAPSFLHDEVASGTIANGSSYETEHYFYCYPNSTATKTRLVVEAQIGSYIYYYPVTLEKVDPNTAYTYSLTITRLGSDSPDKPVEDGAVQFNVTVKDWVEQNVEEII